MNVQKVIKELERLGYTVTPPKPRGAPKTNFNEQSPRVQDAFRNIVKNDNLW